MNTRAKDLARRIEQFNEEVIAFVENCSEQDWRKVTAWEQWPVGVTARHIGAGHYSAYSMAGVIIEGKKLPEVSMEQIVDMANQHAREHDACTKEEVIKILRENGREVVNFVSGLDDAELDRTGYMALMGGDITVQKLLENVILVSGKQHLDGMQAAAGS